MNANLNYRPDIDGLRAVAVLAVLLHHLSAPLMPGGYVGVDVFFVISGYLITTIISREMVEGQFRFVRFYERRARRIFPALFAVLAVTLAAGWVLLLPSDYASTLRGALGTLFFSSNMVFWRDLQEGYFAQNAKLNPLLHTWSLAVEEQFYMFFPILLLVCYRYCRRHIFLILLGCALVSLGGAALLVKSKVVAVFFLSPFRAWELLAGSMLAFGSVPRVGSRVLREALVAGGLLAIVAACFLYDDKTTFPGLAALLPVLGAAAIIHAGASGPTLAGRLLQWRPMVYVGLISYSLYLWHWPLIVLTQYVNGMNPLTPYVPALFVVSMMLGSLSYHFIEQPFRRGVRLTRKWSITSVVVLIVVLALGSVAGVSNQGFASRFNETVTKLEKARLAPVPYYAECDRHAPQEWCSLGIPKGKPNMMLWGDSHMIAWAPALQEILVGKKSTAVLAISSGCPPLLDVKYVPDSTCDGVNLAVKTYLLAHPEIKTVVMAAYWIRYFGEDGRLVEKNLQNLAKGDVTAQHALITTLQWLSDNGREVILIGPVPTYSSSVPQAMAMQTLFGHGLSHSSASTQRNKNRPFLTVMKNIQNKTFFRYLDPIEWLCADDCLLMKDSLSLYRDSNHLSVAGAMAMEANLAKGLGFESTGFVGITLENSASK
ncbi:MAG: acyltransferase family protein [Burkholderiaceae bacterium]|nr:acyltransferase family protein [Burkholderiaceae bacterium]